MRTHTHNVYTREEGVIFQTGISPQWITQNFLPPLLDAFCERMDALTEDEVLVLVFRRPSYVAQVHLIPQVRVLAQSLPQVRVLEKSVLDRVMYDLRCWWNSSVSLASKS
jgi:hypothetical protein